MEPASHIVMPPSLADRGTESRPFGLTRLPMTPIVPTNQQMYFIAAHFILTHMHTTYHETTLKHARLT